LRRSFSFWGFTCCQGGKEALDARVSQKDIVPLYDSLSGVYDFWGTLAESRARKRAIELADIKDGQNILEVAVGTGLAFYEVVRRNRNGQNLGIDISRGMLDKARKRLGKLSQEKLSGAREFHPRALPKPDMNLSTHPAPIVQP